jgi:ribosomal protein L7/L12/mono/diheme cytochrome c family protein
MYCCFHHTGLAGVREEEGMEMGRQFWIGLTVGIVISGIVGGLFGLSMLGRKAIVPPSELEAQVVAYLKALKIPEAAPPATPFELNDENLLEGGEHYNHHCAVCHDLEGDADSDLAKAFNPPTADLTSEEVQRYSDGQLKWIVDNGIRFTGMPGWKDIIDEGSQWKIVHYMRALADSEKAGQLEAGLKARGKWKVDVPSGAHHNNEAEMHSGDEHSHAGPHEHERDIEAEPAEPNEHHHDSEHEADAHNHSGLGEEKESIDVYLSEIGSDEVNVIKEVRAITGLGLSDAKVIVDAAPAVLKRNVSRQEAGRIKERLASVGASVEIR